MKFKKGQYLLFKNYVAKINKIEEDKIKLRKCSFGTTIEGYSFQQWISKKHLEKSLQKNGCAIIPPEKILKILLSYYHKK